MKQKLHRITLLFFRDRKSPLRTLRTLEPVFLFCQENAIKIDLIGSQLSENLEPGFLQLLEKYAVTYRRIPFPAGTDHILLSAPGLRDLEVLIRLVFCHPYLLLQALRADAFLTISNTVESRIAARYAKWVKRPFVLIQWAPTFVRQDLFNNHSQKPRRLISHLRQVFFQTCLQLLGAGATRSYMDIPNAICLFWGPSQRHLYKDQISKTAFTPPISVPYVDQIVNQGKQIQPDPASVLYIMGFSMDASDSDNLLFENRPSLAEHMAKISTVFKQYRDQYGCTNFGIKLRPTDSDYRAFKENEQHFHGFKIYFQEPAMELIGRHRFIFTDCLSSSCVEAIAMGRDVKYIDFEYEHKTVSTCALPVIRDFGVPILGYEDLVTNQTWAKVENPSQHNWPSNNTSTLFKILEDWPKTLHTSAIRELPKHKSP